MEGSTYWRDFFRGWPVSVDRRGVIVASYGEQIPFDNFMTSDQLLMVDRSVPDTMGARKIVIPYEQIASIKFTEVVKTKSFLPLGFEEPPPKQRA